MNQNNEINEKLIETMKFNTYIVAINGYNNAVQQLNKLNCYYSLVGYLIRT